MTESAVPATGAAAQALRGRTRSPVAQPKVHACAEDPDLMQEQERKAPQRCAMPTSRTRATASIPPERAGGGLDIDTQEICPLLNTQQF